MARRKGYGLTRCRDVVLEAAVLRDATLRETMNAAYLAPLDSLRIGGHLAREILRAYFAVGGNISSAAARLKVDRRTVWHRLNGIEARLGRGPRELQAELEIALRLDALG